LFERFPGLRGRVPWVGIATTPTPITELPAIAGFGGRLFAKRDDLTSPLYGGNKVRKFEYLLADAERGGAQTLVTLGGIGSNQCLAATLHGRARGHAVELSLMRQPVTDNVRRALAGMVAAGARIRYAASMLGALRNERLAMRDRRRAGEHPYHIPFGATNALGALGYVGAALELAEQVRAGTCPEPDIQLVTAGTCGTAAGLLVGTRLAGLPSRLIAVGVVHRALVTRALILWYANRTAALLSRHDASVPRLHFSRKDVTVAGDQLGDGYGHATAAAHHAVDWARPHLALETTYTGKTLASLLELHARFAGARVVLFWNTQNSSPFPIAASTDHLPERLRKLLRRS
jgi:D-cysteine desulfhydrase